MKRVGICVLLALGGIWHAVAWAAWDPFTFYDSFSRRNNESPIGPPFGPIPRGAGDFWPRPSLNAATGKVEWTYEPDRGMVWYTTNEFKDSNGGIQAARVTLGQTAYGGSSNFIVLTNLTLGGNGYFLATHYSWNSDFRSRLVLGKLTGWPNPVNWSVGGGTPEPAFVFLNAGPDDIFKAGDTIELIVSRNLAGDSKDFIQLAYNGVVVASGIRTQDFGETTSKMGFGLGAYGTGNLMQSVDDFQAFGYVQSGGTR